MSLACLDPSSPQLLRRLVLVAQLCFVLACQGNARPADDTVREQVVAAIAPPTNDDIEVTDFARTNGREIDANTYEVAFEYTLVFNHAWNQPFGPDFTRSYQRGASRAALGNASPNASMWANGAWALAGLQVATSAVDPRMIALVYGQFPAGAEFKKADTATFMKTEQGWQLSVAPRFAFFAPSGEAP